MAGADACFRSSPGLSGDKSMGLPGGKTVMGTRTIVSSPPGFELLELEFASNDSFSPTPIVAWAIVDPGDNCAMIEAYPICTCWCANDFTTQNKVIRQPDGSILFLDSMMKFEKGDEAGALKNVLLRRGVCQRHQFRPGRI
jgi:hypothetical protein